MRGRKKALSILSILLILAGFLSFSASASETDADIPILGTTHFEVTVPPGAMYMGSSRLIMEAGEVVTISVSYTPSFVDFDVGLVCPDGGFKFLSPSDGALKMIIRVDERGDYYLAIRNNSRNEVSTTGYVSGFIVDYLD